MSDPDDKPKAKIISLDERRRADAARQKAELAASVAAAKKARSNGSGQAPQTYRQQMQGRAANNGGRPKLALGFGAVVAWVVWSGLAIVLVLALIGTVPRG